MSDEVRPSARLMRGGEGAPPREGINFQSGNRHPPSGQMKITLTVPPLVEAALIDHLRSVFQVRVSPHHDLRSYDRMCGWTEVIQYLEGVANRQSP